MPKLRKANAANKNVFKTAVEATPQVATCYKPGLQALGDYSKKISPADTSKCQGSLDIDACTVASYPQENRWDYAIGYDSKVYFVEFHSAQTGEVRPMLKKLQWLKDWLNNHAPEIKKMKAEQPYFWIMSGKYAIFPNSSQAKQIAKAGLRPASTLKLPV